MKCEISVRGLDTNSDTLVPGSRCILTIVYSNTGTGTHRVESVLLRPTWDLSDQRTADIKNEIPAGETRKLTRIRTPVPEGLAGRHGFRIGVKTQTLDDATESGGAYNTETVWMESIRRFEVAGTNHGEHKALVCFSEGDDQYKIIKKLLMDYGYDPDLVVSHDELISQEKPALILGVALSESVSLVSSAMTWAAPVDADGTVDIEEFDGDGTGSVVVQHADVSIDELSRMAMAHEEVETFDRLAIERAIGLQLFKIRLLHEAGVLQYAHELAEKLDTDLGELLDSWSTDKIIELIETAATKENILKALSVGSSFVAGSEIAAADGTIRSESTEKEANKPEILQYIDKQGSEAVVESGRLKELVQLLDHESERVRWESARTFARVASESPRPVVKAGALQALTDALDDESSNVRKNSADALVYVAFEYPEQVVAAAALRALTDALDDELKFVRGCSASVLGSVAKEYPRPVLRTRASDGIPALHKLAVLENEDSTAGIRAGQALSRVSEIHPKRVKNARKRNQG